MPAGSACSMVQEDDREEWRGVTGWRGWCTVQLADLSILVKARSPAAHIPNCRAMKGAQAVR